MYSPFAHLSFWYSALGGLVANPPKAYPFGDPETLDPPVRRVAQRLHETPVGLRSSLLSVLRGQASVLPWSAIHPSWLEPILADYPAQWRLWALALLPGPLRARLEEDRGQGSSTLLAGRAPSWWPAFFAAEVRHRLDYPDLLPWQGARAGLPGILWERSDTDLARLLAVHGTRGLVSAVRRLPRGEAQALLWRLPAQCQPVAQEAVARRLWSDDPFWPEILERLEGEFPELEARVFRMALADWLRVGLQRGQGRTLRRLAIRLPRRWGDWMRRVMDERPDWLQRPVVPSPEAWDGALGALLGPGEDRTDEGLEAGAP
jgi:hypothetical protein